MALGDILERRISELKDSIYSKSKTYGNKRFYKVLQNIAIEEIISLYPSSVSSGDLISKYKEIIDSNLKYIPEKAKEKNANNQPKYWVCLRNLLSSNTGPDHPEAIANNPIINTEIGTKRGETFVYSARKQYFSFSDDDSIFSSSSIDSEMESDIENDIAIQNAEPISDEDLESANNRKPKYRKTGDVNGKRAITIPKIAKKVLADADYKCELCEIINIHDHITFETKKENTYLEAHHLIPIKFQPDFDDHNIDRVENIVALCPTCHRAIHYGKETVKREYLEKLYDNRKKQLLDSRIEIPNTFDEFFNKYYK